MRTILQHYWAPSSYETSGHSAITIDPDGKNEFVALWAVLPDKAEGTACASYFNRDFDTDCRVIGLRKMMHSYFRPPLDPPSGIGIYLILINALQMQSTTNSSAAAAATSVEEDDSNSVAGTFVDIRNRLLNWKNEFSVIASKALSGHEHAQISAIFAFITDYTTTKSLPELFAESLVQGQPTESVVINRLNVTAMIAQLQEFQKAPENMLWAAQVGSQTDRDLSDSNGNRLNRFAMFCPGSGSIPGIKGHQKGKTRHNCSSLILALLQAGGVEAHLKDYVEEPAARLREMIELSECIPAEEKAAKLKKINAISFLPSFSMARYCGTTPHELNEMCKYAENRILHPPVEEPNRCVIQ